MKILLAPDKFKGSLSAQGVCEAIAKGLKQRNESLDLIFHPMADGGDGSLEILAPALTLQKQTIQTLDPLGRPISSQYFTSAQAAFIELSAASGLTLLHRGEQNPMLTSTLGTGKVLVDAISRGYFQIYLFLGGSATNEAGTGIASALGFQFLDVHKKPVEPIGKNLSKIQSIRNTNLFDFGKIELTLLCDVDNRLFGETGAAFVYGSQKGASKLQIKYLDEGLRHFSEVIRKETGFEVSHLEGAGAAGGIGAGLAALCEAQFAKGFETISKLTGLETQIRAADWVISGEGRLDTQSFRGKVVSGISKLCQKYNKPLTLFVGKNDLSQKDLETLKVDYVFSVSQKAKNIDDAMSSTSRYLEQLAIDFDQFLKI